MTEAEARAIRADMLSKAKFMAYLAGDTRLPWGHRYECAVIGDDCLDAAVECDAYLRSRSRYPL
jgi:hypothetical protein